MRIIVYHTSCGPDTDCCGHWVGVPDGNTYDPASGRGRFEFAHPDSNSEQDRLEFARELVRAQFGDEHVADLDWENSQVVNDYD